MSPSLMELSEQAKLLSPDETAVLIDQLRAQLCTPVATVVQHWVQEVHRRMDADALEPESTISHEDLMVELRGS